MLWCTHTLQKCFDWHSLDARESFACRARSPLRVHTVAHCALIVHMLAVRFVWCSDGAHILCLCLATMLRRWALAERGVLRASNIAHSRKDGSAAELLLHQKERKDQPASLFPEPEIAKNSQVRNLKP
jgi:hypothetical protein